MSGESTAIRVTPLVWTTRSGFGRKAHRTIAGRTAVCGTHLGYGNLMHEALDKVPAFSLCGRCFPNNR